MICIDLTIGFRRLRGLYCFNFYVQVQYQFIFQAIMEGVMAGDSRVAAASISQRFAELSSSHAITEKSILQTEYDVSYLYRQSMMNIIFTDRVR